MIQKKICMLGAFAVGKTSLVARYVTSMFSDKYHTTVGVKIDRKNLQVDQEEVSLLLWDIQGEDELQKLRQSYLRGASGYLLVADGTRHNTLAIAENLQQTVTDVIGPIPFLLLVNKLDLMDTWEIEAADLEKLTARGWTVIKTSARSGQGVEDAFSTLARKMIGG